MSFSFAEDIELKWNVEIALEERGKTKIHHRSHNIFTNVGRQFICENISASAFPGASSFTRMQDSVVRYIGFGLGGSRQNSSLAAAAPIGTSLYPGSNTQTDDDVTVTALERPIKVTGSDVVQIDPGDLWMRQVSPIASLPAQNRVVYTAVFSPSDLQVGAGSMPLSEIGLFKSTADPSLPNGSVGAYPSPGGHLVAYDTFNTLHKSGQFSIRVEWTLRF